MGLLNPPRVLSLSCEKLNLITSATARISDNLISYKTYTVTALTQQTVTNVMTLNLTLLHN